MKTRMNFKDEFYQKLKLLVLPIAIQNFMLALVSATDAIMLGWIDQTSLSAVSLAGQVQFVLNLFITGIAAGAGIMAAQYWGKRDAASIEKVIPIALRANLLFSGLFTILAGLCPDLLMRIFTNDAALVASGSQYLRAVALSYVLCGVSQVYLILLKNTGHAAVSSRISSTAVVLNIILNAVLIYGLFGAPALGIRGAAYATVAARVLELIWPTSRQRNRTTCGFSGNVSSLRPEKCSPPISGATRSRFWQPRLSGELLTFCIPSSWAIWEAMRLPQTRLRRLPRASSPA